MNQGTNIYIDQMTDREIVEAFLHREYPFAMKEGRTAPFTINENGTVSRIL